MTKVWLRDVKETANGQIEDVVTVIIDDRNVPLPQYAHEGVVGQDNVRFPYHQIIKIQKIEEEQESSE
jgi:uncharacterized protein (UPF0248 family)